MCSADILLFTKLPSVSNIGLGLFRIPTKDVLVRADRTKPMDKNSTQVERYNYAYEDYKIAEDIKSNNLIEGKKILLIDDILTSKATTDICSTLLCNNGANKVSILCAAETFLDPNWKQNRS